MPPSTSLPDPTFFLSTLITSLSPAVESRQGLDPSADSPSLPPGAKSILLTLHGLFPTLLLPALDLLDRRLVTRLTLQDEATAQAVNTNNDHVGRRTVYYVRSNAHRDGHSRYSRGDVGITSYEVRTRAWSCSCAAFAFSAFNRPDSTPIYGSYDDGAALGNEDEEMLDVPEYHEDAGKQGDWRWGGLMLGDGELPLCKHLLACVLTEQWDVAGKMIDEREIGKEEMSGWAAGWGG